jgi:acetolactate synthase-1/2/3 large subunit
MALIEAGKLFAKALKREGVEQIFTLAGAHIMPIYYGCRDEGIEIVDFRHECAATNAADAYARITGKLGVVVTTAGPGIMNTTTAMSEAQYQGTPLLHIGGGSPSSTIETGDEQEVNTLEIMGAVTKWARRIEDPHRIPEYVSMAFRHAFDATPGPVYLEIGFDTALQPVEEEEVPYPEAYRTTTQPFGDPAQVEKAAELLIQAKRPLILIGSGTRFYTQQGESIAALAEFLQIPVSVQTVCRGLFADEETNPLFRFVGAEAGADIVLMLDVNPNFMVNKALPPLFREDVKFIQVSPDVTRIGFNAPAKIGIVGGSGPVAHQILQALKRKVEQPRESSWLDEAGEFVKESFKFYEKGFTSDESPMHPGRCAFEVAKFLNEEGRDWTVVCDGGDAAEWIVGAVTARRPGQIVMYGPNGTIGTGAGFSTGAWVANRKPILYYVGDGSFGFYPMEFDTYLRHGVQVVCVISNDSAWGMIKQAEKLLHPEEITKGQLAVDLEHMRAYEKLVEIWDGYGVRVTSPEEIAPAIRQGFVSGKPSIINVEVNKNYPSPYVESYGQLLG